MAAPRLLDTVIDTLDARAAAEFWRMLLDLRYRPGDEEPKGQDWLVLTDAAGARRLAFQQVDSLHRTTWPHPGIPQQLHLDLTVATREELDAAHATAISLGATLLHDRSDDPDEPLRVYADLDGHPFCVFVA